MKADTLYNRLTTKTNLAIALIPTIIFLTVFGFQVQQLTSRSYLTSSDDLQRIDSAIVYTRAYHQKGRGSAMIFFDDKRGNSLRIVGASYSAVKELGPLYDTLQYSGTALNILISKKDLESYYDNKFDRIELYGVEIDGKSYLSLKDINKVEERSRFDIILFASICFCIFLILHFARVRKFWMKSQEIQEV